MDAAFALKANTRQAAGKNHQLLIDVPGRRRDPAPAAGTAGLSGEAFRDLADRI